ncbi:MAG: hypothetical protein AAFX99_02790 [Myxococcota bacterium]
MTLPTPNASDNVPRLESSPQFNAAARDLVISLADTTSTTLLSRGYAAPNRLLQANLDRLLRALTAVAQVSGGRVAIDWADRALTVNGITLDSGDANNQGALRLLAHHFGHRGINGLRIRGQLTEAQVQTFLHQLKATDREVLEARIAGRTSMSLTPDLGAVQLVLAPMEKGVHIGDVMEEHTELLRSLERSVDSELFSQGSERLLLQPDRAWRALGLPAIAITDWASSLPKDSTHPLLALTTYTHLHALTCQVLDEGATRLGLPVRALQRLIIQLDRVLEHDPDHLIATALLSAFDNSPARRISHTALWAIGLGRWLGADPSQLLCLGLAAFVQGIAPGDPTHALTLLPHTRVMLPEEIQAIQWAVEARRDAPSTTMARLIRLAEGLSAALDGTLSHQPGPRPWPEALQRLMDNGHDPGLVVSLVRWLGPLPPGSIVELSNGHMAVANHRDSEGCVDLHPFASDGQPLDAPPQSRPDNDPNIVGWPPARPLVRWAAHALFQDSQSPLLLGAVHSEPLSP